jgi:hypothetical protein
LALQGSWIRRELFFRYLTILLICLLNLTLGASQISGEEKDLVWPFDSSTLNSVDITACATEVGFNKNSIRSWSDICVCTSSQVHAGSKYILSSTHRFSDCYTIPLTPFVTLFSASSSANTSQFLFRFLTVREIKMVWASFALLDTTNLVGRILNAGGCDEFWFDPIFFASTLIFFLGELIFWFELFDRFLGTYLKSWDTLCWYLRGNALDSSRYQILFLAACLISTLWFLAFKLAILLELQVELYRQIFSPIRVWGRIQADTQNIPIVNPAILLSAIASSSRCKMRRFAFIRSWCSESSLTFNPEESLHLSRH